MRSAHEESGGHKDMTQRGRLREARAIASRLAPVPHPYTTVTAVLSSFVDWVECNVHLCKGWGQALQSWQWWSAVLPLSMFSLFGGCTPAVFVRSAVIAAGAE